MVDDAAEVRAGGADAGGRHDSRPDALDPEADYRPYDDLVAGRGHSHVEADYVDRGLGGIAGMELSQFSPMGEVGASARIFGSSAVHRRGWRRTVLLAMIFGPIVLVVVIAGLVELF